jgi:hypothetical protein
MAITEWEAISLSILLSLLLLLVVLGQLLYILIVLCVDGVLGVWWRIGYLFFL